MIQSIHHNIRAMEALRNMKKADHGLRQSIERLSTGRINNSSDDDPSNLVLDGTLNNQIRSVEQAIKNNEIATMFVQTAEASLNEISEMLIRIRQLAVHASNEGVNDEKSLAADQAEIDNILQSINQISDMTQFGNRNLLDGSNGTVAFAVGEGMQLLGSSENTKDSPVDGYPVNITQIATKSFAKGSRSLTAEEVKKGGIFLEIEMDGRHVSFVTKPDQTPERLKNSLQKTLDKNFLPLEVSLDEDNILTIESREYGSKKSFTVANSASGILTSKEHKIEGSKEGKDIVGTIGGYAATGKGQLLTGEEGTPIEGMVVKFEGELNLEPDILKDQDGNIIKTDELKNRNEVQGSNVINPYKGGIEGIVHVNNKSLFFHIGAGKFDHAQLDLKSSRTTALGKNTENESGFKDLSEISVMDFQSAQDTIRVADTAISEIATMRAKIGAVQSNVFERNQKNLAQNFENLSSAKSEISDTNVAKEISELTKNKMWLESTTGLLSKTQGYNWMSLLRN